MTRLLPTLLMLVALLAVAPAGEARKRNPEIDYLSVAEVLLRDGAVDRAEAALAEVDPAAEGVDLARYHTVRGLIASQRNDLKAAAAAFEQAIAAGQTEPMVVIYLAQAYFAEEAWRKVIDTIARGGDAVLDVTAAWSMRAHAHWTLGERQQALDQLSRAAERFPANTTFTRRQIFYLIEVGLHQEAARVARAFLARDGIGPDEYATVGSALRRARAFDEAKGILEAARLRFPEDATLAKSLAQVYLESGQMLAAAEILNQVAIGDPSLLPEAAELYRRAGHLVQALALNARVPDSAKKLKQRIGILAELRRYEQIAGMAGALERAGLLADEDVRYALAFAYFRGGDFERAERHLAALTKPDLFRKATELRRIMADCADQRWTCG
jgi:tetratricopeptide (TPR) repeat protein